MQTITLINSPEGQQLRTECEAELALLVDKAPATRFACLGTVDGRNFSFAAGDAGASAQRLSAMTCSLLALAESFAKEALKSRCAHATLATDHGSIVIVRVPSRTRAFALAIGADSSDVLAATLRHALDLATRLASLIDRHLEQAKPVSLGQPASLQGR